jgi:hypothetical protein
VPVELPPVLLVDAANVLGSRPDGWWKDRAGATRRLLDRIRRWAEADRRWRVIVVVEGRARAVANSDWGPCLQVIAADGSGDDAIVDLADDLTRADETAQITVVTSDRGLHGRLSTPTVGARWLQDRLPD